MYEIGTGRSLALNWRGPLIAAGIFAAAFALLLIMAHQNESNTTDMGSSVREDPYGTSLLFDSYARAGYQVKRSEDEDSLADQDGSKTTAFFIGHGSGFAEIERQNPQAANKFLQRLEDFLARGGRAVLIEHLGDLESKSHGWEVEDDWSHRHTNSGPTWIEPDPSAMPAGSEPMYLRLDIPSLKTNSGWTPLYSTPAKNSDEKTETPARVYMAMRKCGNGELIAVSQQSFLLNETVKSHPNPVLLDFLTAGRSEIWVDETLHGLQQNKGVLWLVRRYRLQLALMLFWAALLVLLWSLSGDLMRRPARDQIAQIMRNGESAGTAARRLLQRSVTAESVVMECWDQFRCRGPQDAQAISADPALGKRLRAAFKLPPLAGYRELSQLIAERRASAKALAPVWRRAVGSPANLEKTILKEERFS